MAELQEQQLTCDWDAERFPEKHAQPPKWQEGQKSRVALQLLPAEPPGNPSAFGSLHQSCQEDVLSQESGGWPCPEVTLREPTQTQALTLLPRVVAQAGVLPFTDTQGEAA